MHKTHIEWQERYVRDWDATLTGYFDIFAEIAAATLLQGWAFKMQPRLAKTPSEQDSAYDCQKRRGTGGDSG